MWYLHVGGGGCVLGVVFCIASWRWGYGGAALWPMVMLALSAAHWEHGIPAYDCFCASGV